jgi:polysaccharide chain length determinant protein (PEP-CTERM system associated)
VLPGKKYTFDDVIEIANRRKWIVVVTFALVTLVGILGIRLMPVRYTAETVILVVPQKVPESYVRSTVTSGVDERVQLMTEQILSRNLLERIIHEFNLYPEARQTLLMEDVVARMRGDLDVVTRSQRQEGASFSVKYVSEDPEVARGVAERLATLFVEENVRQRASLAEGTSAFLDSQLTEARNRLVAHEKQLEVYQRRYAGELPSQLQSNLQIIQNAQLQLQALSESMSRDRERRLLLERTVTDLRKPESPVVTRPPAGPTLTPSENLTTAQQLQAARSALQALELRLKPEHPDILRQRRQVQDLESRLERERAAAILAANGETPAISPAELQRRTRLEEATLEMEQLDGELAQKQVEADRLRGVIDTYERRVEAAPARETDLVELTRDYRTLQEVYSTLLSKKEESKVAAELERRQVGEQFKVLEPARMPERPSGPGPARLGMLVALLGLGLGIAIAALVEYRDTSLRTQDDVRLCLDLPVLAVVPVLMSPEEYRRRVLRTVLALALGAAAWVGGVAAIIKLTA